MMGVGAVQSGSVTHTMHASSMSCASAKAQAAFPQLNLYVPIGVIFLCQS